MQKDVSQKPDFTVGVNKCGSIDNQDEDKDAANCLPSLKTPCCLRLQEVMMKML